MEEIDKDYQVGDSVKVSKPGERFWCTIIRITRSRVHVKVDNHLVYQPYKFGQIIAIKMNEICYKYEMHSIH